MAQYRETPEVVALGENAEVDIVAGLEDPLSQEPDTEDSLTFSNAVIEKIVAIACQGVEGVVGMKGGFYNRLQETFTGAAPTKGVAVEVMQDNTIVINISIVMEYGAYAPTVFERVRDAVIREVASMTGLTISGVNLRIEDIMRRDEGFDPLDPVDL